MEMSSRLRKLGTAVCGLPFGSFVNLWKLFNLPEPQPLQLQNGDINSINNIGL